MIVFFIADSELSKATNINHGFFGKVGGKSSGIFSSLNCGYGSNDDKETVIQNIDIVKSTLKADGFPLCTARQIHSEKVITLDEPWTIENRPEADGLVTKKKNIALGILTADCAPVLFVDEKSGVIGACHAGWKGAKTGIVENTVSAMVNLGAKPENIVAVIGPCIGPESYEVGQEFYDNFVNDNQKNKVFFKSKSGGKYLFDLPKYVENRLKKLNLKTVKWVGKDTLSSEKEFFSYRRSCLNKEKDYGRQLSVIILN